jgi:peptidylprolyl isomerase
MTAEHPIHSAAIFCLTLLLLSCGGEKTKPAGESPKPAAQTTGQPAESTEPAETRTSPAPEANVAEAPAGPGDRATIAEALGIDLSKMVRHSSGLEYVVRKAGTGAVPKPGERIRAHYTGYLLNGKKFDSSVDRGEPFATEIGVGRVIRGWDIAFTEMKVGEKRVLFIPPNLGYGARGAGGVIPPNADLVFDVELLEIAK